MNTRQQDIITLLERHGEITIKELSDRLSVSEMTIHRDLDHLQAQRYLYKKRGAAVYIDSADRNINGFYAEQKRRIGRHVAALIQPGQSILFDNSTTAMECARFLDKNIRLTFYTTSMETAQILSQYKNSVLYCSGGYFFPESRGFLGKQAEDFVDSVKADVCIIGASGVSIERGITTPYPAHTTLQKKILAASSVCLLAADHSKFGKVAMEQITQLSQIDRIITDDGLDPLTAAEFQKYVPIEIV